MASKQQDTWHDLEHKRAPWRPDRTTTKAAGVKCFRPWSGFNERNTAQTKAHLPMNPRYALTLLLSFGLAWGAHAQPPCLTNFTTPAGQTQVANGAFTASGVPATTSVTLSMTTTTGSNLATLPGSPFSYEFIPAGREAWREVNVNLSSLNASVRANMQVMIEFVSDGGNNFFLDDIRWTQTMGGNALSQEPARVYPNPATHRVQVELPAAVSGKVEITLREIAGGRTIQVYPVTGSNGPIGLDLPAGLAAGAYLLDIRSSDGSYRFLEKLLVE